MEEPSPWPVVIGGSPGVGKTSVAKLLAQQHADGVHVESDYFFRAVKHLIDPSLPASKSQNEIVVQAYCEAARVYQAGGMMVFLEGVIGPWWLPQLKKSLGQFHYILLHLPLEMAIRRVAQRQSQPSATVSKVDRMYPQFAKIMDQCSSHVISSEALSIREVTTEISRRIKTGENLIKE
jgi:thymidylate kinase